MAVQASTQAHGADVGNLRASVTSFLGRGEELAKLERILDDRRLITLTGAPGIGKSRLAVELARRADGDVECSWIVELASVTDGALVASAIATTLAVPPPTGHSLAEAITTSLRARRVLLVLDNCEHVLEDCARVVETLVATCPMLSIVTTSREPLAVAGEVVWPVPPLSVPSAADPPLPEVLASYEAVALFVDRACSVQPAFVLNRYVAPSVADICVRLDGLPLAIELAAALSAMLTPAEIAARLHDRFGLLTRGSRSDLRRHQTLRAAVDGSHDLLSPAEQVLLRRLSTFVGGFCLEACEAVCAGGDVEPSAVFDLLARLVSRSLVVADTVHGPRARYRLLETIRAYASDRLEDASEAARLRKAHAAFYLALAERAEPELSGRAQVEWLERLEVDRANLRAALEWSLGHGHSDWALRLAGALTLYWRVHCHFEEGRDLLVEALEASNGAPAAAKAKALWGCGFLTQMSGDSNAAAVLFEQSVERFDEAQDASGRARALMLLGSTTSGAEALALLEESITLAREAGDSWCVAHALTLAGHVHERREEPGAARPLLELAVLVAREAGDKQGLRYALYNLGINAGFRGDFNASQSHLRDAIALMDELGDIYLKAPALEWLAQATLGRGDSAGAHDLLDGSVRTYTSLGVPGPPSQNLITRALVARTAGELGQARELLQQASSHHDVNRRLLTQQLGEQAAAEGDLGEARRLLDRALDLARAEKSRRAMAEAIYGLAELARSEGDVKRSASLHNEALSLNHATSCLSGVASSLEAIAGLAVQSGRYDHAARLFSAAEAIRAANGIPMPMSTNGEGYAEFLKESLPADELELAWAQGQEFSLDEAVAQASKGRGSRGRAASGWESLTASERRVADLVAEGLTNPEIAARLIVTQWTVKSHLKSIFRKLDVTRRSELTREVFNRPRLSGDPH